MKTTRLTLTVLAVLALSAGAASANNSWNGYHWERSTNPVSINFIDSVTGSWDALLGAAATDWSASDVVDTPVVPGDDSPATRAACNPEPGSVRVCNYTYGQNGWLGVAQIWLTSNGHIVQGISAMNDSYFETSSYDDDTARLHVMCQENGHTLGLDHQKGPKNQSCMNDQWGLFSASFAHPNNHDYSQLESIYCHLDGGAECSGGGQGGGNGKGKKGGPNAADVRRDGPYTVVTFHFPA